MTDTLTLLRATEKACADRLASLQNARHRAQTAMETANTVAVSAALSDGDARRLVFDEFNEHLAKALHSQFYMLIDEAEHELWKASGDVEAAETREDAFAELRSQGFPADVANEMLDAEKITRDDVHLEAAE